MRLLLAEDEKSLSKAVKAILEAGKYSVDAVFDGEEALDYLETDTYDGVILDIMMPKKDGLTVLKELRNKGNLIPVLLLTAKSEVDDIEAFNLAENLTRENAEHLFDRFYRADASRNSETGGHGIGLSMAKAIVEGHGGKIGAEVMEGGIVKIKVML